MVIFHPILSFLPILRLELQSSLTLPTPSIPHVPQDNPDCRPSGKESMSELSSSASA